MNLSSQTRPSLDGTTRIIVTVDPARASANPALDLVSVIGQFEHAARNAQHTRPMVEQFAMQWGLPLELAEQVLKGDLRVELDGARLALFVDGDMLSRLYLARVGLVDGGTVAIENDDHWLVDRDAEQRVKRMRETLGVHARHGGFGTRGSVGSEAQLCELLCDLRMFCDREGVDLHHCLDVAYERYMHERHRGLTTPQIN